MNKSEYQAVLASGKRLLRPQFDGKSTRKFKIVEYTEAGGWKKPVGADLHELFETRLDCEDYIRLVVYCDPDKFMLEP